MLRTVLIRLQLVTLAVVVCGGIPETSAAPQLQPLLAQFNPEARGYAAGYGYGHGGVQVPVAVHVVGPAVGKTVVHYADAPTVVGYAPSAVYKPDLSAYAAASFPQLEQLHRFDPVVRPVHAVVPKVTAVKPSVTVHKTYIDVPVAEYRPAAAAVQAVQDPSIYSYNYQVVDRK